MLAAIVGTFSSFLSMTIIVERKFGRLNCFDCRLLSIEIYFYYYYHEEKEEDDGGDATITPPS